MIRIHVIRENDEIKQITLKGHANYDEYGKDIVCAAVSATFLCTVNGIFATTANSIQVKSSQNTQIVEVIKPDTMAEKLLGNMLKCLENLQQKYPNNIEIR